MKRSFLLVATVAALVALVPGSAPGQAAPAAPTGVTGIALDTRVELAWKSVAGATAYHVYRGTTPTSVTTRLTPAAGVAATSFADTTAANGTTYYYVARALSGASESVASLVVQARPAARSCSTGNAVVLENCYPGASGWRATNVVSPGSGGIEGFATANSINKGEAVDLRVNSAAGTTFNIEIYRSGYYGGNGARLFSTIRDVPGVAQPTCTSFPTTTGLVDCSNWSVSASVSTTAAWPSGVYLLRLVRNGTGRDNHILLTIRDDARHSQLLYGTAVTDYQAYNNYGGKSLYDFNSSGATTAAGTPRAVKVSFDRPYIQSQSGLRDWYPKVDYPAVYWLELSGYDVAYQANTDMERNPQRVRDHLAYFAPAHDEYYSLAMRNALKDARDAGTDLFFSGSNNIYWKIRFENSPVSGAQDRVQVTYKSTQSGGPDPSGIPTGTWRDPAGANLPENALIGILYVGDKDFQYFPLVVSAAEGNNGVYRYTGLDAQPPNTSTSIGSGLVGWEWDARRVNGFEPPGVITLASSPVNGNLLQDAGQVYAPGSTTVHVTKYTAASGALVFATGTNHWARGLANNEEGVGEVDLRIQQVTTNVLADMGIQPQTPGAGIELDTPGERPPAPTGVTAQVLGSDSIRINWNAVAGVDGYHVYRTLAPRVGGEPLGARVNSTLIPTGTTTFTDTGLSPSTTYYYVVTSVDVGVQSLASSEVSGTTSASAGAATRINSGGPVFTSSTGQVFSADTSFVGGATYQVGSGTTITGTNDPALYRNERWGNFQYTIPVAAGTYEVRLHFVELYFGTAVAGGNGKRVFSVDVLDKPGLEVSNLDIYQEVGPRAALIRTVPGVTVSDGVLNVNFIYGAADDPEVAAIEVIPTGSSPPTVTDRVPAPGATGIARDANVRATFSRAMDASTITASSFTLRRPDTSIVPATVTYDAATRIATLDPTSELDFGTTYTARLETTIKAADGEALAAQVTWSFTTVTAIAPTVTATVPANGATGVSPSVAPTATFSRAMDASTITNTSFTLRNGASIVPATVTYSAATTTATLTPNAALANGTTYTGRLETTIKASDGVPLAAVYTWSFTTASTPPPPPTVTNRVPAPGATGVARNATVDATFSRDMDASTITTGTFTLTGPGGPVAAAVTYTAATRLARLTPSALLAYSTTYTATLSTSIRAADGTPLASAVTWTFTTANPPPAPTVTAVTPAEGATFVSRATPVTATFSIAMDPATITNSSFTVRPTAGSPVAATVAYNPTTRVATLTPSDLLAGGTEYTARVETTVTSDAGAALATAKVWTFSTAACPCSLFSVAQQPAVQNLDVRDGRPLPGPWSYEFGVRVTVDQPMQLSAIRFYKDSLETGTHVGRVWTSTGTQLTSVTFTGETASGWQQQALGTPLTLNAGTIYVVSVNVNAYFGFTPSGLASQIVSGPLRSVVGTNGVYGSAAGVFPNQTYQSSNYFADLVVVAAGDPSAPTVTSTVPAAGATGVDRATQVRATFSRPLNPSTVNTTTFRLTGPGGPVTATVSYDSATNTAILTPSAPLAYSTSYTAQLTTGIRASDGVALASPVTWSFTVTPFVTNVIPAAGATDVATGVTPQAQFANSLNPSTINASTFTLTGPGGPVAATVAYNDGTRTATLTPSSALTAGSTYTARLDGTISTTDGTALGTAFQWSFSVSAAPPLAVTSTSPANGATNVSRSTVVTATFNRDVNPATLTSDTFRLLVSGSPIPATLSYNAGSRTATLTPSSILAGAVLHTAQVTTGVQATDGTPLPSTFSWTFTTSACPCSLFAPTSSPTLQNLDVRDGRPLPGPWSYELGVKVTVDSTVQLTAIRFYKDSLEVGTHTGRVWSASGTQLASVAFTAETASGWQQQTLGTPLTLTPGNVYVISINVNAFFGVTPAGLATQVVSGPLRSVVGSNGVYGSAAGVFPNQSYNNSNYFTDLVVG